MKTTKLFRNRKLAGKMQVLSAFVLFVTLFSWTAARAQITPSQDSFTNSAAATTNYGTNAVLDVDGAIATSYIQFNLSSIPAGASVSQATLKLYVNTVTTAGSFNVDYVNGTWAESTITYDLAPALGKTIVSSVPITTADKNQYILINVTPAVQAWLSGSEANDGLALVANSTFNATFDSKENTGTSHPAELDIVFAGDGTLTGVTTASGSGLTGGGTSGTLNLGLTNACSANQVLQWNGSAWACAAVGTGTVTSVASGTGLSGGPITGSGTLSINTAVVPQLAAANTFTGNQTVNGNLTATGAVSGSSFQIGSNLFGFGSYTNGNAFLGFAGSPTVNQNILQDTAVGVGDLSLDAGMGQNTAVGYQALLSNTTGYSNAAIGVGALYSNNGAGNTAIGYYALGSNTMGALNTATGFDALASSTSCCNVADGMYALLAVTNGQATTGIGYSAGNTVDSSVITGNNNTALGTGSSFSTGSLTNATAIGANAVVGESNALVLGSIAGVNNQTVSASVGIGTTVPSMPLEVNGSIFMNNQNEATIPAAGVVVDSAGARRVGIIKYATLDASIVHNNATNLRIGRTTQADVTQGNASNFTADVTFDQYGNVSAAGNVIISGDLNVAGSVSKGSGSFKIDDPLDPANKYLYHSFVESPDMMNVYNGNIVTDQRGVAIVTLPNYFEALNRDFRYQLTVIGQFAQAIVAEEIASNHFVIRTSKPSVKVSWQVTGIRHDAYADAHRIPVEVEKPAQEQGHYLHPELFGAPETARNGYDQASK